jgi:carboxylate-amine ligase
VRVSIPFAASERSTLGVEWELALVDAATGDLRQDAQAVFDVVRPPGTVQHPNIRQELMLNTVEVVSGVCHTVRQAGDDLERAIAQVRTITDPLGIELMSAGTHPFARSTDQHVSAKERYETLIDRTQWWGRQMLIFGGHTHVGVDDQSKVIPLVNALLTVHPHLQALAASSPYWLGEDTGYASQRALIFQQLPTAGLPAQVTDWAGFEAYTADMLHVGVIDELNEIRWDIRPAPWFGTIEARVCDASSNMTEVLALAAFTQCLVEHFSSMLDAGLDLPTLPAWFVRENKWRSARYGMDAILITSSAGDESLVADLVRGWLATLEPVAARLGCLGELADVGVILERGASYQRQRAVAASTGGDLRGVVASLVAELRAGRPL